jgi:HD-GYP domain-containing protein (c-di-GMP phosphodiesterase class II)
MMPTTFAAAISLIALLFYCVLLGIVLTRDVSRKIIRRSFALYLASMIIWSFGSAMVFLNSGLWNTITWVRLMVFGSAVMPITFVGYVQVELMRNWRTWLNVGYFSYFVLMIANVAGWVITQANLDKAGLLTTVFGPGEILSALIWVLFVGFAGFNLLRTYRSTNDPVNRNRIKHLLLVIGVIFLGALTNATPLSSYPVDIAFNILSAILIANAIFRHQLLDIDVVVRKGLLYSIPTILVGTAYFGVIWLVQHLFGESTFRSTLISLGLALLAAVGAQPIWNRAQRGIDRLFFRERYDSGLMLQRISHTAASMLDLEHLTSMILEEITQTLHIDRAAFFLKRAEDSGYYLISNKGLSASPSLFLTQANPIVQYLIHHDQSLTSDEIAVQPQFRSMWGQERADLDTIGAVLYVPLKIQQDLVGIFAVGPKRSEQSYTHDDQLTLVTMANQTAVAIENARLFSAEQFRREELDALYRLTRELIATDEVDRVLESTARNAVESIHVTFCKVFTPDEDGSLLCQTVNTIRPSGNSFGGQTVIDPRAKPYYEKAIRQAAVLCLKADDPSIPEEDKHSLGFDHVHTLWFTPLRVGQTSIGLLVLGEERKSPRQQDHTDRIRLMSAFADQAASALQRAHLHEEMEESFVQTIQALAKAADERDTYTHDHSQRLAYLAEATGRELKLSEDTIKALHWSAILHDIGKIGIPDDILRKPGPLTEAEWSIMKRHPLIGGRIVAPIKNLGNVAPIIRAHHERYDGNGYPFGLKGENIPIGARLLTVVDAYGAMTDDRVYRKALTHAQAVAELYKCSGTQFDPKIIRAFLRVLDPISLDDTLDPPIPIELPWTTKTKPLHGPMSDPKP